MEVQYKQATSPASISQDFINPNIHAHVLLHSNAYIKRQKFKTYMGQYGYIDFKKIRYDNGILEYLNKEEGAIVYTDAECICATDKVVLDTVAVSGEADDN